MKSDIVLSLIFLDYCIDSPFIIGLHGSLFLPWNKINKYKLVILTDRRKKVRIVSFYLVILRLSHNSDEKSFTSSQTIYIESFTRVFVLFGGPCSWFMMFSHTLLFIFFYFTFPHLFIINFNLKNLGGRRLYSWFYGLLRYQPVQQINKWICEQNIKLINVNTPLSICLCKTAYCRNSVDGHWYSYDDSSVELVPEEELCTRGAYILFYQRRNVIPPWSANSSVRGQWMSLCGHVSYGGWLTFCFVALDRC